MEHLAAFENKPKEEKVIEVKPIYNPIPTVERYDIIGYEMEICRDDKILLVSKGDDEMLIPFADIPDLVQFFAWAMMNRMKDDLGENV